MKNRVYRVERDDPRGAVATALIAELSAELKGMYPNSHGGDGKGAFRPEDVLVPRAALVVAWDGDTAVGCGALRPMHDDNSTGEIKRMFVRPAMRGKGISRHILTALEDIGREFGYTRLILETGKLQIEAIGLYELAGYRPMGCYDNYVNEPLSVCYEKGL